MPKRVDAPMDGLRGFNQGSSIARSRKRQSISEIRVLTQPNLDPSPTIALNRSTPSTATHVLELGDSEAAGNLVGWSRATIVSLWCVGISNAAALVAGVFYSGYLQSLEPSTVMESLDAVGSETAYQWVSLAKVIPLIMTAIFFLRWFYLAYQNLSRYDGVQPDHSPSWAVWGFFIPVVNLFRPREMMQEVWAMTSRQWEEDPDRVIGLQRPSDYVNLWWGMFLATNFFGNAVSQGSLRATTAHESLLAAWATLFADAFGIVAVCLAVILVRNVTALQRPILDNRPAELDAERQR